MKAAILTKPGHLEIKEIPAPTCPASGVLVKVKACGICAADVKMVSKGHRALIYPRVLGHEIAGVVAESRTRLFQEGMRVQVAPGLRCGICIQCRRGYENQCEKREILGFTVDGGFADYVAVPIEGPLTGALKLLNENVSYLDAVWAEPLACCLNALEKIDIKAQDTVLIMGAGPLGLLHAGLAGLRGAEVLIAEVDAHRRKSAKQLGADRSFDPTDKSFFQTVADATSPKGVDVIILATSEVGLDEKFIKLLAPGGRISVFSGTSPRLSKIQLDSNLIHYNELIVTGAYGCTANQNYRAIDLIASKKIPVNKLITQQVTLDKIAQGLEYTKSKRGLKSIVEVQDEH